MPSTSRFSGPLNLDLDHRPRRLLRSGLGLLAAALLLSTLAGCVSVRSHSVVSDDIGDYGAVEVRIYQDDKARRSGRLGPRFVVSELERFDGHGWQPVFRSLEPAWSVAELPAGRYRLLLPGQLDDNGHVEKLDYEGKDFRVTAGEVQKVEATLEHTPTGWIVAGVVAAIILHEVLDELDLHPPLLDDIDEVFHLTVDIGAFATGRGYADDGFYDPPPVVTSHFPADGDLVATNDVQVVFALSEPLVDFDADAIAVLAEDSGLVEGTLTYDDEYWWLIWQPDYGLPRGETLHVTLDDDGIKDYGGNELQTPRSFTFRTTM